ncbi:MAG: serine hydrolase domain-containing protein [Planctomycetota bacterium]|jgi:CubicO group peptidase (beta-lactamase class C family)
MNDRRRHVTVFSSCGILLAAVFLAGAASGLSAAEKDDTVVRGDLGEELDAAVLRVANGSFWGSVLVARKGKVLLAKGYGMADYSSRPNDPRTLFEIASTSKQFTAAAVLKLEMEKKLSLQDPLTKFFKRVPKDKKNITVHQLLTHTSGMDPNSGLPYASRHSRKQFVRFILRSPLVSKPGEKFAYFNSGYALLAAIVEVASGKSFEAYSKEKLFKPAGLVDTGFVNDKTLDARRATARECKWFPGATAVKWCWSWGYRGMGGVVTTVYDLFRWDRALRGEAVLNEEAKKKFYTPALAGYALGWFVEPTERGTRRVHHGGGVAGYGVYLTRYLEEDAVVVVLSNGKSNVQTLSNELKGLLFGKPEMAASIDVRNVKLSRFRAAQLGADAAWLARKGRDGKLHLMLLRRTTKRPVATIQVTPGYGRNLASRIESLLDGKDKKGSAGKGEMDAGIYLGRYNTRGKTLELREGLSIRVQPRYLGQGENGEQIVDERITFILEDSTVGQWPVMVKMGDKTARKLAKDLAKAAGG